MYEKVIKCFKYMDIVSVGQSKPSETHSVAIYCRKYDTRPWLCTTLPDKLVHALSHVCDDDKFQIYFITLDAYNELSENMHGSFPEEICSLRTHVNTKSNNSHIIALRDYFEWHTTEGAGIPALDVANNVCIFTGYWLLLIWIACTICLPKLIYDVCVSFVSEDHVELKDLLAIVGSVVVSTIVWTVFTYLMCTYSKHLLCFFPRCLNIRDLPRCYFQSGDVNFHYQLCPFYHPTPDPNLDPDPDEGLK